MPEFSPIVIIVIILIFFGILVCAIFNGNNKGKLKGGETVIPPGYNDAVSADEFLRGEIKKLDYFDRLDLNYFSSSTVLKNNFHTIPNHKFSYIDYISNRLKSKGYQIEYIAYIWGDYMGSEFLVNLNMHGKVILVNMRICFVIKDDNFDAHLYKESKNHIPSYIITDHFQKKFICRILNEYTVRKIMEDTDFFTPMLNDSEIIIDGVNIEKKNANPLIAEYVSYDSVEVIFSRLAITNAHPDFIKTKFVHAPYNDINMLNTAYLSRITGFLCRFIAACANKLIYPCFIYQYTMLNDTGMRFATAKYNDADIYKKFVANTGYLFSSFHTIPGALTATVLERTIWTLHTRGLVKPVCHSILELFIDLAKEFNGKTREDPNVIITREVKYALNSMFGEQKVADEFYAFFKTPAYTFNASNPVTITKPLEILVNKQREGYANSERLRVYLPIEFISFHQFEKLFNAYIKLTRPTIAAILNTLSGNDFINTDILFKMFFNYFPLKRINKSYIIREYRNYPYKEDALFEFIRNGFAQNSTNQNKLFSDLIRISNIKYNPNVKSYRLFYKGPDPPSPDDIFNANEVLLEKFIHFCTFISFQFAVFNLPKSRNAANLDKIFNLSYDWI